MLFNTTKMPPQNHPNPKRQNPNSISFRGRFLQNTIPKPSKSYPKKPSKKNQNVSIQKTIQNTQKPQCRKDRKVFFKTTYRRLSTEMMGMEGLPTLLFGSEQNARGRRALSPVANEDGREGEDLLLLLLLLFIIIKIPSKLWKTTLIDGFCKRLDGLQKWST